MKFRPMRAELFNADIRTDGRTGMTKVTGAIRNSAKEPKNVSKEAKYYFLYACVDSWMEN